MAAIRVLVADDSMTVRKRLVQALSTDAAFEVIAEAGDGRTATELCQPLRPDVVTMDVMMPVMDGVTATEYIMANCPTPILVVSASSNRGRSCKPSTRWRPAPSTCSISPPEPSLTGCGNANLSRR